MPSYDEVMQALRNADAAGNVEDARKLADIAARLRPSAAAPTPMPTPAPTPAPPPRREVGFVESAGRTAAASTIPVVKMFGLAAATAARLFGRGAQDKVFEVMDRVTGRMEQAYRPQAGEEFSTAGQFAGGIASMPVEVAGGFGLQHGVERAQEVVQRGGSLGDAGRAGAVTGAVRVGMNALPVKVGGTVGRAVESKVGRIVGGGLTGGGLAAVSGTAGRAAENAALPEGEQFADLAQPVAPTAAEVGLGAALGAVPGAAAAARTLRGAAETPVRDLPRTVPEADKVFPEGIATAIVKPNPVKLAEVAAIEKLGGTANIHNVTERPVLREAGRAAQHVPFGGGKTDQNVKAITEATIKLMDPDAKDKQISIETFDRLNDKNGSTIRKNMSSVGDVRLDEDATSHLMSLSKQAADIIDRDQREYVMKRIADTLNAADAKGGKLSGSELAKWDSAIGEKIRDHHDNADLTRPLRELQEIVREAAEKHMPPEKAKETRLARRRYAYGMTLLPDIKNFGATGYIDPGRLWDLVNRDDLGKRRTLAGGSELTDLAKAAKMIEEPEGHGRLTIGTKLGIGTGAGAVAYLNPAAAGTAAATAIGGSRVYNRWGPVLVKRLAKEYDARQAKLKADTTEPPPEAPPPKPEPPPAAPETPPTPPIAPAPEQIPVGRATEMTLPEAQRAVSQSVTDPRLAKIAELRQQAPSAAVKKVLDAREAEIKKVIKREKDVADLEAAAQATDDVDLRQSLLAEANKLRGGKLPVGEATEGQPALPKDKAKKIPAGQVIEGQPELPAAKAERIPVGEATEITPEVVEAAPERLPVGEATEMPERLPVGEVTENPIPVGEAMEFEHLPVGEATEITPEAVEPARGPVVPKATNVDNAPAAPAGGGRSEGVEQTKGEFTQSLAREPASWVIREKTTGKVVMETFDRKKVDALNTEKYEAVPVLQYLQELNRTIKENTRPEPQPTPTAPAGGGRSEGMEQTKAPPKPEDFANGAEYHLAVREWRSKHGAKTPEPSARTKAVMDLDRKIKDAERRLAERRKMRAGLTPPAITAEAIANIEKELLVLREQRAAAAQQETPRTPQEVTQQAGVPAEPQGRTGGREAAEAGAGDRAQRAAESGGQSEGAKKEGVKPARPATKPAGKALTPTEVKAEFQRQIDAVPRFGDGGPETITLKAGGSTVKIQNTARRVAEYMKALGAVKGGKTPKPVSEKKTGKEGTKVITPRDKSVVGSEDRIALATKTWGGDLSRRAHLKTITDMIDDFDPQAAVDFAAAQGIDLEEALKGDRKRLDRVRNLKPTPETP